MHNNLVDAFDGEESPIELLKAFKKLRKQIGNLRTSTQWDGFTKAVFEMLYQPTKDLLEAIDEYKKWSKSRKGKSKKEVGDLMEKISHEVMRSLVTNCEIESFISVDAQLDLVITGSMSEEWGIINDCIGLINDSYTHKIIIEAKNTDKGIDSNIFSRLCYLVDHQFNLQCHLGIFFSRNGASGFELKTALRAARATQILFHAHTGKYIVVFDHADILTLDMPGRFLELLRKKISDIENIRIEHDTNKEIVSLSPIPVSN